METAISFENVSKRYKNLKALDNLSLSIEKVTIFGLLGPNGAGKTTTLRICSTLLKPDEGQILFDGKNSRDIEAELRRSISLMPQGKALDPMLNVRDNLRYYAKLIGLTAKKSNNTIERLIELFGLNDYINKSVFAISGGQFRRAQLARTFLGNPSYILLDEPTLGIDIQGKLAIWKVIRDYAMSNGCTIILASNDITEIEKTCDKVGFINQGKLLYTGDINKLSTENYIRLDCKLKTQLDLKSFSIPDGINITNNGYDEISITFIEYNDKILSLVKTITSEYGLISLAERRMSLTDLFEKYGGST